MHMKQEKPIRTGIIILLAIVVIAFFTSLGRRPVHVPEAIRPDSPFTYSFKIDGILREAGSESETTSPYWWVNSGGALLIKDGMGLTLQGAEPKFDSWRLRYVRANADDTDNGYHPQNLFRLISRSPWKNPSIETSFLIVRDNLSTSTNRNESNGLLLMSRYALDGQTLYYAGVRVDGTAVIKKKYHGTYYTMAQKQVFDGTYDRDSSPNLLPHGEWITLRSDTVSGQDGTTITLFMRRSSETGWTKLLTAADDGTHYDGTPDITESEQVGIRTDFMDVQFKDIRIQELNP